MFGIVNAVKFDNFFLLPNSASVFEALPQARKMRNCHRDFCFEVFKGESMDAAADDDSFLFLLLFSCVNPILYAFLSDNFRKAFHHLLPPFCHRRTRGGAGGDAEDSGQPKSATGMLSYQITTKRR